MTELRFEEYRMNGASLGEESALPDIHVNAYIRSHIEVSDKISGEDARYIGKGMISTLLPYRIQDGYNRKREERPYYAAILENEFLRATFLPELGGRLWSLYDKVEKRELLYCNDVFQPANLALRNAWFSGGVEWNVGIKGHNPLTSSPLFTLKCENSAKEPVLRMYEYERIRGVVYSLDAALKDSALLVTVTIENKRNTNTPMYWWSNIAVPETSGCRVLAPAKETFYCGYTNGGYFLDKAPMPVLDGVDITYPENSPRSRDFFFDIPDEDNKWIAAVDSNGKGLLHLSDPILRGRKLFVWGNHTGGRHWNEWLSDKAGGYVEIQAGLLKTQLEHFVMPANSTISFQECYTALSMDPKLAFGEYSSAVLGVSGIVKSRMQLLDRKATDVRSRGDIVSYGSGWGALEEKIRHTSISANCEFPEDSMGKDEKEWLSIFEGRAISEHMPNEPVSSFAVDPIWLSILEKRENRDWYLECQLGVIRYALDDIEGAKTAFISSYEKMPNAWALRNLAMIEKNIERDIASASVHIKEAHALLPEYRPLTVECAEILIGAEKSNEWIGVYESLSPNLRADGRLTMLYGAALARLGEYRRAANVVTEGLLVPDIKEGEYSLSEIWIEIYSGILAKEKGVKTPTPEEVLAAYPLPRALDFRMH
ncbi:MAG: DUF5107 domain-containing protein [Clostridia bacterium]|nr:DUF5107 domain-containing protein [Clostridia bacterium]